LRFYLLLIKALGRRVHYSQSATLLFPMGTLLWGKLELQSTVKGARVVPAGLWLEQALFEGGILNPPELSKEGQIRHCLKHFSADALILWEVQGLELWRTLYETQAFCQYKPLCLDVRGRSCQPKSMALSFLYHYRQGQRHSHAACVTIYGSMLRRPMLI
jgi:hypothetical protein